MAINFKDFGNKLRNADIRLRVVIAENQIKPTDSREIFFSSDKFQVGANVLIENTVHEIIDKRSNYVVVINESGAHSKQFHTDLEPTEMKSNYKSGTYKGVTIPEGLESVIESSDITDPFGLIKVFGAFKMKNYKQVFESADKVGLNLDMLSEAVDSDHQTAIDIVASLLGVKLTKTNTKDRYLELKKKAGDKHLSQDKQSIYKEMMGMLSKLGLAELYGDEHEEAHRDSIAHRHTEVGHGMHINASARKMRVHKLMS